MFGLVLGLMAWIYFLAMAVLLGAEVNAVLHRRLWPRALPTLFTDRVELTEADRAAYRSYAYQQRFKSFETIRARFGRPPGRHAQPGPDQQEPAEADEADNRAPPGR